MKKPVVLMARKVFPQTLARLREYVEVEDNPDDVIYSQDELIQRLQGKAGVLTTGTERIDARVLAACPELKVVANGIVGYNNLDVAACAERGVICTNTPDVLTETTADFGMALLLATARRVTESEHYLRAGHWDRWSYDQFTGADVHGATLGIIGMGRIGQAIARRAVFGFDMRLVYHNRSPLNAEDEKSLKASYMSKAEVLAIADHVMLVLPYSAASHHTIGAAELALMKSTATLINLARGGIVDDAALALALKQRQIAAAGLDVFEGEPQIHPGLLETPHVVLTPHIASASLATRKAMTLLAADNLIAALGLGPNAGRPPTPIAL